MRDALSLMGEMKESDIAWLLSMAHEQQVLSNAVIIAEGSRPDNIYCK
jgi:hypothetical protein